MKESEGTEEITAFPLYPYLQQGQQTLSNCKPVLVGHPGDKSYRMPSPHPTTPRKKWNHMLSLDGQLTVKTDLTTGKKCPLLKVKWTLCQVMIDCMPSENCMY